MTMKAFLSGGGEAGALMRGIAWASTPLGEPATWPSDLRALVRMVLAAPHPTFVAWGPRRVMLYNDAYAPMLGLKHPETLGRPFFDVWPEVEASVAPLMDRAFGGEAVRAVEIETAPLRNGKPETAHFSFDYTPMHDDAGGVAGIVCVCTETTDRVLAERKVTADTERQRRMFGQAPGFIAIVAGHDHVFEFVNDAYLRLVGERPLIGKTVREGLPELVGQGFYELLDGVFANGERFLAHDVPIRLRRGNGSDEERFLDFVYEPIRDDAGKVTGIFVEGHDVTATRQAREALRASEERYRSLFNAIDAGFCIVDVVFDQAGAPVDYRFVEVNQAFQRQTGLTDAVGTGMRALAPKHEDHWFETYGEVIRTGVPARFEYPAVALDDRYYDVHAYRIGQPGAYRVAILFDDISERRRKDARLRDLNADLERRVAERTLARGRTWEVTPDLLGVLNDEGYFESSNPAWMRLLGWTEEEIRSTIFFDFLHPDDLARNHEAFEAIKRGQPALRFENRYRTKAGDYRWLSWVAVPENGKFYCTARDVTAEKEQADTLAERTQERDRIWQVSQDMLGIADGDGIWISINPAWQRILGWDRHEIVGKTSEWLEHPDDRARTRAEIERLTAGGLTLAFENRFRGRDGDYRSLSWTAVPVEGLLYCVSRDVTLEKERAATLLQAEEALRQSQKLEAVGHLTGGVAHDFNNLLTVIKSSTDLLKRPNLSEDRRDRYIGAISDTVDRAAKLTGQLLAFARRQALRPVVFDAGQSVRSIGEMVGTLTGARITVAVRIGDEPCHVSADPSQFDTALVNMAVNARDAMDGEGRLDITVDAVAVVPALRSHPAQVGDFVRIALTDTGSGIPPDQVDRIFEPFFTTKGVGQGTGLGLSQVFGFAKQSGGEVLVESEVERGTTFALYLPRVAQDAEPGETTVATEQAVDGRGTCVLVVEDNRDVGTFSTQTLQELGYGTHWVMNADDALAALVESPGAYDVVFSDVVMPGMNGVDLGREVRRLYPSLPVVLTSGYSHVLAEESDHGFELLQKPYSVEALSRILRHAASKRRCRGEASE
ncbi:PAS domain-containing protein [Methylobacterium sp. J-088]|uniref:hybrid sensor histidine kinase/response regulator n=1 Tax=Methylobacterium sp. J-088 TaxID=2836664 RepID=UPI001FBB8F90|nr:PAS domain-containing protein [Methylobacterium sp. J-088]MCJ2066004.1 PAS domain-containing protein [Methylobacterium sp. J-088]